MFVLQVDPRHIGPRLGHKTQVVVEAAKNGQWQPAPDGTMKVGDELLHPGEFAMLLKPADEEGSATLPGQTGVVVLDLDVTPDLEQEGLARDVVRLVQTARKEAELHVGDRIHLVLEVPDDVRTAVRRHGEWIKSETLARDLVLADTPIVEARRGVLPGGRAIRIGLEVVNDTGE